MISFDMDGVLCFYDRAGYDFSDPTGPAYLKPGYFLNRIPDTTAVELLRRCLAVCPNGTYIITSVPKDSNRNRIILDKLNWIDQHIPEFDIGAHFIATTSNKMSFIEWLRGSSITRKDILIDDYNTNLYGWTARGGTAIKYINGINDPLSYVGEHFKYGDNSRQMFEQLMRIVKETK